MFYPFAVCTTYTLCNSRPKPVYPITVFTPEENILHIIACKNYRPEGDTNLLLAWQLPIKWGTKFAIFCLIFKCVGSNRLIKICFVILLFFFSSDLSNYCWQNRSQPITSSNTIWYSTLQGIFSSLSNFSRIATLNGLEIKSFKDCIKFILYVLWREVIKELQVFPWKIV